MIRPLLLLTLIGAAVGVPSHHHRTAAPATIAAATPQTSSSPTTPRATPTRASRSRTPEKLRPRPRRSTGTGSLLQSTSYCETGLMANGHRTYRGAVAGNRWPLGTRLHVSNSPYGPGTFTVTDRIGHGSQLDFAIPGDCTAARTWGRRSIRVVVLP